MSIYVLPKSSQDGARNAETFARTWTNATTRPYFCDHPDEVHIVAAAEVAPRTSAGWISLFVLGKHTHNATLECLAVVEAHSWGTWHCDMSPLMPASRSDIP